MYKHNAFQRNNTVSDAGDSSCSGCSVGAIIGATTKPFIMG